MRSTQGRIQIATLFGSDDDQSQLNNITTHLAHTENIHKSNYRKSIPKNDVNVTKFLEQRMGENGDESVSGKFFKLI